MSTLKLKPLPKQWEALKLLMDEYPQSAGVEEVLFGGGGGGGKSVLGAMWLLLLATRYPGIRLFVARRELKDLHQTTWPSIQEVRQLIGLPASCVEFKAQDSQIFIRQNPKAEPSVINLVALKWEPSDPHYDRYGSYQYTAGWFEEVQECPEKGVDVLGTRVGRWRNDEYGIKPRRLYTANPSKNWLYRVFYKPWREKALPPTLKFVQALHGDNKYLSQHYVTTLANIRDSVTRQRIKDGIWEFAEDGQLVPFDAIRDLWHNAAEPGGVRAVTCDVARFGGDRVVIWLWEGAKATLKRTFTKRPLNYTAGEVRRIARENDVPWHNVVVDEDGVGGGVVDAIPGCTGFTANHAATVVSQDTRENFASIKAQCGYGFAEDCVQRRIRIEVAPDAFDADDPDRSRAQDLITADIEQLRRWDGDKEGKLRTMPKEEILKNLGRSPDFLDSLVIRKALDAPYYRRAPKERAAPVQRMFDKYAAL